MDTLCGILFIPLACLISCTIEMPSISIISLYICRVDFFATDGPIRLILSLFFITYEKILYFYSVSVVFVGFTSDKLYTNNSPTTFLLITLFAFVCPTSPPMFHATRMCLVCMTCSCIEWMAAHVTWGIWGDGLHYELLNFVILS